MEEIWKDIKGYEGHYAISNFGRIMSIKKSKRLILALSVDEDGYLVTHLTKDGKRKNVRVHRLVAEAFIPNPDNLPQVNHKDEDKINNVAWNLEWCDNKYNINYGTRNENVAKSLEKRIIQYTKGGTLVRAWSSISQAANELGYDISNISSCCRGKLKSAYGYVWEFA